MKRYFRGNTPSRNRRIQKIHNNFKKHQLKWVFGRIVKHFGKKK